MNRKTIGIAVIVVAVVAAFTGIVSAVPSGATELEVGANETRGELIGAELGAVGGNVTEVNITIAQQTAKWQGYYGNVSGTIVLDDVALNTMYSWIIDEPTGEVYATPLGSIPVWTNYTHAANTTNVSSAFNLGTSGTGVADNATDTFNAASHTAFDLAGTTITGDVGPCAKTFDGTPSAVWETVILTDGTVTATTTDYLFVGLIRESGTSFKGTTDPCDYQMIVPDNPEDGGDATTYYFYVEVS